MAVAQEQPREGGRFTAVGDAYIGKDWDATEARGIRRRLVKGIPMGTLTLSGLRT